MPSKHRTSQGSFKYYGPGLDGGEESKEAAVSRVAEEVVPVRGIPSIVCTCYVLYCTVANLLSIPGTVQTSIHLIIHPQPPSDIAFPVLQKEERY